jgi:DNA-binding NarL/FixJ family response regulator
VARGDHAVAVARSLRPDVVVMDLAVPGLDGLHATRLILAEAELAAGVLLLAASVTDSDVVAALRAGARGVLLRDSEPRELLRAVRMIAAGGALLAPQMTRRLIAELLRERTRALSAPAQLEELTNREREIMALVAYGLSNAEVAERLSLSPATVKTHVARAVTKLGVRDRAQLAVLAYETGLVAPARPR